MTLDELVACAEELVKPSYLYRKAKKGDAISGYWFNASEKPLTFAAKYNDELHLLLFLGRVIFDTRDIIELDYKVNLHKTTKLTKTYEKSYPSLDYLFYYGNEKIQTWLEENNWKKEWGHNGNFKDKTAEAYESWWQDRFPLYSDEDLYAVEGGWPMTWPDDDAPIMFDHTHSLLFCTLKDPEPWFEVYVEDTTGLFTGYSRIT